MVKVLRLLLTIKGNHTLAVLVQDGRDVLKGDGQVCGVRSLTEVVHEGGGDGNPVEYANHDYICGRCR